MLPEVVLDLYPVSKYGGSVIAFLWGTLPVLKLLQLK